MDNPIIKHSIVQIKLSLKFKRPIDAIMCRIEFHSLFTCLITAIGSDKILLSMAPEKQQVTHIINPHPS